MGYGERELDAGAEGIHRRGLERLNTEYLNDDDRANNDSTGTLEGIYQRGDIERPDDSLHLDDDVVGGGGGGGSGDSSGGDGGDWATLEPSPRSKKKRSPQSTAPPPGHVALYGNRDASATENAGEEQQHVAAEGHKPSEGGQASEERGRLDVLAVAEDHDDDHTDDEKNKRKKKKKKKHREEKSKTHDETPQPSSEGKKRAPPSTAPPPGHVALYGNRDASATENAGEEQQHVAAEGHKPSEGGQASEERGRLDVLAVAEDHDDDHTDDEKNKRKKEKEKKHRKEKSKTHDE